MVDDRRSVRKCWLHRRQCHNRDVPTGSVATVGNWLVREYFWRRDQEAPWEKQEKLNTEDLTYSRHVWCAASRNVVALARLKSHDGKTPHSHQTMLLFAHCTHPRISIIRHAIVDRCLHRRTSACPGSPGTLVVGLRRFLQQTFTHLYQYCIFHYPYTFLYHLISDV